MEKTKISENEIPYEELAGFGLTQEMIDDFPEKVMDKFLSGQRTPLLPIERADQDGVIHKDYARVRLVQTEEGIHPVFLPLMAKNELASFSEVQKNSLRDGEVLRVVLRTNNSWNYVQLDEATNSIISVKADIIDQNLSILSDKLGLQVQQVKALQDGAVLSMGKDGKELSVGIDLNEETGIRSMDCSKEEWLEQRNEGGQLEKYSFGIYGCWTKGDDGKLSYVPEEKYTDEMVHAQEELVAKARQNKGVHM